MHGSPRTYVAPQLEWPARWKPDPPDFFAWAAGRTPVDSGVGAHNHHPHISFAEGHWPDAIFYPIVIDGQISIVQIACERLPAVQAVVDRLSSR